MRRATVATATAVVLGIGLAVPAAADDHTGAPADPDMHWHTVISDLGGPRQLSATWGDRLVVAESDTGRVAAFDHDEGMPIARLEGALGAQGVDYVDGRLFVTVGAPPPGEEPPPGGLQGSTLNVIKGGEAVRTVDLMAYELANNPDGQVQFVDEEGNPSDPENGQPVDALSNPYGVLAQSSRILVADAGANAVIEVGRFTGRVSTFFVPPTITDVEACQGDDANANPGAEGCDPVPTEIAEGPDGNIYLATLGAERPGAAKIYVLSQDGDVVRTIDGLTGVTGVAVDDDGTVYASELFAGAEFDEQGLPVGDPATFGRVVRIAPDGERSAAQVTLPNGLEVLHGHLFATAWSIGAFLGPDANTGEVREIHPDAFEPITE